MKQSEKSLQSVQNLDNSFINSFIFFKGGTNILLRGKSSPERIPDYLNLNYCKIHTDYLINGSFIASSSINVDLHSSFSSESHE